MGTRKPKSMEMKLSHSPNFHTCRYQIGSGQWVQVDVGTSKASTTAEQTVQLSIGKYTGSLEKVTGLGDAALYTSGSDVNKDEILAVARLEGTEMRTVAINAFFNGHSKDGLIKIARIVLREI
ncbi:hypothetical protein GCM10023191_019280 [Actinoallomurus oryzae]|uniref:Uncharacterized protein n=1 Tax=Actinoallomurus oryzae TaxID=502180 RepID=A0ABP8PKI0_9ACTN